MYKNHLITSDLKIEQVIKKLDKLASDAILFVLDSNGKLLGSLTDGDIRRGFIKGFGIHSHVNEIMFTDPKFIEIDNIDVLKIRHYRESNLKIIPIVDEKHIVVDVLNFRLKKTILPIDVVIIAGGKGTGLSPLTSTSPKALLSVGDKTIIEHIIDRLIKFGIKKISISINNLGEEIRNKFEDGSSKGIMIDYLNEDKSSGNMGSFSLKQSFDFEHTLILNSDIITTIDFEDYYINYIENDADLSAVATPYSVDVPFGVFELLNDEKIKSVKEKPTYTFDIDSGIYLIKSNLVDFVPETTNYTSVKLIKDLIMTNKKVIKYFTSDYWLNISDQNDYKKALEDIKKIEL